MNAADPLLPFIETWRASVTDLVALLETLKPADWNKPTDLPGWNVKAVAAHCAHLESELCGRPQRAVEIPADLPHVKGLMGQFTEAGPVARQDVAEAEVIAELRECADERYAHLLAVSPLDPAATADGFAALVGWTWQTLLSNRPLDIWMHEQDIRRAVQRPGGLDTPGAQHTVEVLGRSLPFLFGKKAGAPTGATLVVQVTGALTREFVVEVPEGGRARLTDVAPDHPTVRLTLDVEAFIMLLGGRRPAADLDLELSGDPELGAALLADAGVTP